MSERSQVICEKWGEMWLSAWPLPWWVRSHGRSPVNKSSFFGFEGRWYGILPGSPLCVWCPLVSPSPLSALFSFLYFLPIRSSNPITPKKLFWSWVGCIPYNKTYNQFKTKSCHIFESDQAILRVKFSSQHPLISIHHNRGTNMHFLSIWLSCSLAYL